LNIVVILPTYNEHENIQQLLSELYHEFQKIPHDFQILVVDDNSPDGTGDEVRSLKKQHQSLHLLQGKKQGLGAAYLRGFEYAIRELNADAIVEMDSDFSHKPQDLPRLVAQMTNENDFIIGSRYIKGGKISDDWSLRRKLTSKYGNIVARYVVGLYKIKDCTAGFRVISRKVLEKIDLSTIHVNGYAFQVVLLHKAVIVGANVKEVPVEFVDRIHGQSKLGLSDIIEFFINAWWIRLKSSKTFLKFCVVGLSGIAVNLLSFTALLSLGMNKYLASPVAIEISIVWNFFLNNGWTFKERDTKDGMRIKGLKFNAVSFISLGVSYTTFLALSFIFPTAPPHLHQLAGIIPASIINYFMNSYWTFRTTPKQ